MIVIPKPGIFVFLILLWRAGNEKVLSMERIIWFNLAQNGINFECRLKNGSNLLNFDA